MRAAFGQHQFGDRRRPRARAESRVPASTAVEQRLVVGVGLVLDRQRLRVMGQRRPGSPTPAAPRPASRSADGQVGEQPGHLVRAVAAERRCRVNGSGRPVAAHDGSPAGPRRSAASTTGAPVAARDRAPRRRPDRRPRARRPRRSPGRPRLALTDPTEAGQPRVVDVPDRPLGVRPDGPGGEVDPPADRVPGRVDRVHRGPGGRLKDHGAPGRLGPAPGPAAAAGTSVPRCPAPAPARIRRTAVPAAPAAAARPRVERDPVGGQEAVPPARAARRAGQLRSTARMRYLPVLYRRRGGRRRQLGRHPIAPCRPGR